MKALDIIKQIENIAPTHLAQPWDNVGLLCGSQEREVKRVLLTLDINQFTLQEAISADVDMIISHHPMLLKGIQSITPDTQEGLILLSLIQNNIIVYSAHTNLDVASKGLNTHVAKLLGLTDTQTLIPTSDDISTGFGKIGVLKTDSPLTLKLLSEHVKKALNTSFVRLIGNPDRIINKIAILTGGGGDFIPQVLSVGADVFITGDMKYHIAMDAVEQGLCVIDAGHYPTEIWVMDVFEEILKPFQSDITIIKSKQADIFQCV